MRLEATIKRFIGDSSERKPQPGEKLEDGTTLDLGDLPPGSSFLEEDTGLIARWNGQRWSRPVNESKDELDVLNQILAELRDAREESRTGLPVLSNQF